MSLLIHTSALTAVNTRISSNFNCLKPTSKVQFSGNGFRRSMIEMVKSLAYRSNRDGGVDVQDDEGLNLVTGYANTKSLSTGFESTLNRLVGIVFFWILFIVFFQLGFDGFCVFGLCRVSGLFQVRLRVWFCGDTILKFCGLWLVLLLMRFCLLFLRGFWTRRDLLLIWDPILACLLLMLSPFSTSLASWYYQVSALLYQCLLALCSETLKLVG